MFDDGGMYEGREAGRKQRLLARFFGDEVLTEESYVQGKENVYL